jgi:hypothetical protein
MSLKTPMVFGALLTFSAPAFADWQYTRWGMTPDEVAAAAKGQAPLNSGTPGQTMEGYVVGNVGTYQTMTREFSVVFYYQSEKLSRVQLKTSGDCFPLMNELRATYGHPNFDNRSPVVRQLTWRDHDGGNTVTFSGMDPSCSILYEPLNVGGL